MKKIGLLWALSLMATMAMAQKMSIVGVVTDEAGKPLETAAVVLLNVSDSSLVTFGRTNDLGVFLLKNVATNAPYLLRVTYVGFDNFTQNIAPNFKDEKMDLGVLSMHPLSKMLDEAVISAERDPVKIKGDTLEFNASSFKTQPNATAEELLKKLPGVEVEKDGTVKAQGEQVQQIYVNGKKFFGKDPKLATQNLPAGAIEKVQVFDKKSDQSEFSGIDDGQKEKSINFQLKESFSKGTFGNITGGLGQDLNDFGHDNRFILKGGLNRFDKKQQFSVVGLSNNINTTGFTTEDYLSYTGAAQRMASGGGGRVEINGNNSEIPLDFGRNSGFTTTYAGGANYNNQMTPKTELNGSYFYNKSDKILNKDVVRQNFLADRNFKTLQNSQQNTINDNHRMNLSVDQKIDSFNSLKLTSSLSLTKNSNRTNSQTQTLGNLDSLQNTSSRLNNTEGSGVNVQNSLLLRHRFPKKGRTISTTLNFNYSNTRRDGFLDAENQFFSPKNRKDTTRQEDDRINDRNNYGAALSYTEPLGNRTFLELNYSYQKTDNFANRMVNKMRNGEPVFDSLLSNIFDNSFTYHRSGLTYRINRKEWNLAVGGQFQTSILRGLLVSKNTEISRDFFYFLPNMRLKYDFSTGGSLNFDYDASVNEPSIEQLQPVRDNSDPLNITLGNPDLKPEYGHRLRLRFNRFDQATFRSFFSSLNVRFTENKITTAQTIDSNFIRKTQPINVRNDYSVTGFAGIGLPLNGQKLRLNFNANLSYNRGIGVINTVENTTNRTNVAGTLRLDWRLRDTFELNFSGKLGYNRTDYSLQNALNQVYYSHEYELGFSWILPFEMRLASDFNYLFYVGQSFGNNQAIPIWNAQFSKYVMKNKRGELKLSVFDILNRNLGFTRSADVNYIQDERVTSLARYFTLSFTYAINPMLGKGGGRRQGGMRMQFRE